MILTAEEALEPPGRELIPMAPWQLGLVDPAGEIDSENEVNMRWIFGN